MPDDGRYRDIPPLSISRDPNRDIRCRAGEGLSVARDVAVDVARTTAAVIACVQPFQGGVHA